MGLFFPDDSNVYEEGKPTGFYAFMGFLLYWRVIPIPVSTVVMYFISGLVLLGILSVYMPLHVLFEQTFKLRMLNIAAYISRNFIKVLSMSIFQMVILTLTIMLAPWTLFLLPVMCWYFRFAVIHKMYDSLNEFFSIEDLIEQKENLESE